MKIKVKNSIKDDIVDRILENRGINNADLDIFLHPTQDTIIPSKFYYNMETLVKELLLATERKDKIALIVDSDCDGYCSGAMMYKLLTEELKYENLYCFLHSNKSHGLTDEMMKKILENNIETVIIVDAGSNDYEQHKKLKELGINILIVDHHECETVSDDAIIINNQFEENKLANKSLSAGGMMLKLIEYISETIGNIDMDKYYDLGAVAIIADMMELRDLETRYYVFKGLREFKNPLFIELVGEYNHPIEEISFSIAPLINCITRVGTESEKLDLFYALTGKTNEVTTKVRGLGETEVPLQTYVVSSANKAKRRQAKAVKDSLDNATIYTDGLPFTIVILDDFAQRELTGLIGNKVVEIFNKPALVFKNANGILNGSARTTPSFQNFKDFINNTGLFNLAQGHQGAFGIEITIENLGRLYERYKSLDFVATENEYEVDKTYTDFVSAYDILKVSEFKDFWCKGFEKPKFHIRLNGIKKSEISIIGKKSDTLKIVKNDITFIKFKCSEEEIEKYLLSDISDIDIIATFSVNEWNDRIYCQAIIEDIEFTSVVNATQNIINHFALMGKSQFTF